MASPRPIPIRLFVTAGKKSANANADGTGRAFLGFQFRPTGEVVTLPAAMASVPFFTEQLGPEVEDPDEG